MDRTQATVRKLLAALPAPGYDLGILSERGMYRLEAVAHCRILRMLPYLKYRNAHGAHLYIRPTGESAYTLLDDLTPVTLARLDAEGYSPAAVVETSPGNFQAWLRHTESLSKELGTLLRKPLPHTSGRMGAPPTGGGSDASPASPTASLSTAMLGVSIPLPASSVTPASPLPPPRLFAPSSSTCSSRSSRNALRSASATPPVHRGLLRRSPWPGSARRRVTTAGQPPPIWRSRSPRMRLGGRKAGLRMPSPLTISRAIRALPGGRPTSVEPRQRPFFGPSANVAAMHKRRFCGAGEPASVSPHPSSRLVRHAPLERVSGRSLPFLQQMVQPQAWLMTQGHQSRTNSITMCTLSVPDAWSKSKACPPTTSTPCTTIDTFIAFAA